MAEAAVLLQKYIVVSAHVTLDLGDSGEISVKKLRGMRMLRRRMKDLDGALKDLKKGRQSYGLPIIEWNLEKVLATYTKEVV